MKLDELLVNGARTIVRNAGHDSAWDAGLGKLVGMAIDSSAVPKQEFTVHELAAKAGITPKHAEVIGAGWGLLQHFGLVRKIG
jgi:hypothetical protein